MTEFIHVGYAKTMSTSLQMSYFSKHKDIYYLGVGNLESNSVIDYIDEDINSLLEFYIRYSNDIVFEDKVSYFRRIVNKHRKLAQKSNKKAIGISFEGLSIKGYPGEIHSKSKAMRLKEIFQGQPKIIIFIRNQFDLLKSLYNEYLRNGIYLSFNDFITQSFYFRESNFFYDLLYDKTIRFFKDIFGENVEVFIYEDFLEEKDINKIKMLDSILGIDNYLISLKHYNQKLDKSTLFYLLQQNYVNRHDVGLSHLQQPDTHRLATYLKKFIKFNDDNFFYKSARIKNASIDFSKKMSSYESREIDYTLDKKIEKKLQKIFIDSNSKLSKENNLNLPLEYYNLSFENQ